MAARFGFWAALAALFFSLAYGVPQILQVAGWLIFPLDEILIFAPSLALAPSFVLALAALHETTPAERRVWSLAALSLGILYAAFVSFVYVIQLSAVIPAKLSGGSAISALFGCCSTGAPLTGVDLLGYTMMSLATLLAAGAVRGRPWLAIALVANGALAPVLILQTAWPWLIWAGALWLITFPAAMALLAAYFWDARR